MAVFFVSDENDIHCDAMRWALSRKGVSSNIWSFASFPLSPSIFVRIDPNSDSPHINIEDFGNIDDYSAIWYRRVEKPVTTSPRLAKEDVEMSLYESHLYIEGLKPILMKNATWVNPAEARRKAQSKALQLAIAKQVGFSVPDTLMANDPIAIRSFFRDHRERIIYKTFHQGGWTNRSTQTDYRTFTNRVSVEDLQEDVAISSCPGIYQELIDKNAELRVTFFGSSYYAMRIYSQQTTQGKLDFRSDVAGEAVTEVAHLDSRVLEKCKHFAAELGLLHGSFDFIEAVDGRLVFLEVNEMGQFLWLEDNHPELPLLSAATSFTLDPRADFTFSLNSQSDLSFAEYRRSPDCAAWEKVWKAYVERGRYPNNYWE
jgi:hypothetical protein